MESQSPKMAKINHDLVKVFVVKIGIVVYSAVIIYFWIENKNDLVQLKRLASINLDVAVWCSITGMVLVKSISFYFKKKTGIGYGDTSTKPLLNFVEYLYCIMTSFSMAALLWMFIFFGLVNK